MSPAAVAVAPTPLAASPYAAAVIADGASHYWRLGETSGTTAVDQITTGNAPGTISGGVTLGVPGPLADGSTAMSLPGGSTAKVQTAPVTFAGPSVTLEGWVKTSQAAQNAMISGRAPGGFATIWYLGISGTGTVFSYTGSALTGTRAIADGQWHHLVAVMDRNLGINNEAITLYVDGLVDVTSSLANLFPDTGQLTFGHDLANVASLLGAIDEVAIYPVALTPAQIANHYALRLATAATASPPISWGAYTSTFAT